MAEKVKLKVNIAGRHYPMTVNADEEEIIRKAGKEINDAIRDFEQRYDIRDKQDALAMCALQIVAKSMNQEKSETVNENQLVERLQNILNQLNKEIVN